MVDKNEIGIPNKNPDKNKQFQSVRAALACARQSSTEDRISWNRPRSLLNKMREEKLAGIDKNVCIKYIANLNRLQLSVLHYWTIISHEKN